MADENGLAWLAERVDELPESGPEPGPGTELRD
jgi:hypothetical protein